nr:hypothetical protein [Burkholderia gladioli]
MHGLLVDGEERLQLERDDLHREVKRTLSSRVVQSLMYDPAGRIERQSIQRDKAPAALSMRRYRYDAAGQLTQIEDSRKGATDCRYDPIRDLMMKEWNFRDLLELQRQTCERLGLPDCKPEEMVAVAISTLGKMPVYGTRISSSNGGMSVGFFIVESILRRLTFISLCMQSICRNCFLWLYNIFDFRQVQSLLWIVMGMKMFGLFNNVHRVSLSLMASCLGLICE